MKQRSDNGTLKVVIQSISQSGLVTLLLNMRIAPQVDLTTVNQTWFSLTIQRQLLKEVEHISLEDWTASEMNQLSIYIQLDKSKVSTMKGDLLSLTILDEGANMLLSTVVKQ